MRHPNAEALNAYLFEMVVNMERIELDLWKRGISPTLKLIKEGMDGESEPEVDFRSFARKTVAESRRKEGTKNRLATTLIYQEVMTETMVKDLKGARRL